MLSLWLCGDNRRTRNLGNNEYAIRYCLWKKTKAESLNENLIKWIGCDSGNCRVEWFHYKCVGIKQKPKRLDMPRMSSPTIYQWRNITNIDIYYLSYMYLWIKNNKQVQQVASKLPSFHFSKYKMFFNVFPPFSKYFLIF